MRPALRLLLCLLVMTACASGSGLDEADVVGDWRLVEATHQGQVIQPVEGYPVGISLNEEGILGMDPGCNQGGGTYDLVGGRFLVGEVGFTAMACDDPVMAVEEAFTAALEAVEQAELEGGRLRLDGQDVRLVFERVHPLDIADLAGRWTVERIDGEDVQGDVWVEFDQSGAFNGNTGCRDLDGRFVVSGDELQFTELAAHGDCPADLADQDSAVVSVIERPRVVIDGDQLTLIGHGGPELVAAQT